MCGLAQGSRWSRMRLRRLASGGGPTFWARPQRPNFSLHGLKGGENRPLLQKESELIISDPAMVAAADHVAMLIEFLTKRTLPSPISILTPPEWGLQNTQA